MITYDLHAPLEQTSLALINHRNEDNDERLLSCTHLASVYSSASAHGMFLFLGELLDAIVDTKVSKEANSRQVSSKRLGFERFKLPNLASSWMKIYCGWMNCRDELNASLEKALKSMKVLPRVSVRKVIKEFGSLPKEIDMQEVRRDPVANRSGEMADMSRFSEVVGEHEI